MRRLRLFLHLLRLLFATGLMYWIFRRLPFEEIQRFPFATVNLWWLALAFVCGGISVLGWAGRWWWFLRVYEVSVPFRELLRLTFFADFFNLYFLGPLGADGVRLLGLSRLLPERRGAIVGSLLLDHAGGLLGGVILYGYFGRSGALPTSVVSVVDQTLPFLVIVAILGLGVIMEPPIQRVIAWLPGLSKRAAWMSPIYAGTFRHPWLFTGFAISLMSTISAYAAYWSAARAIGADLTLAHMLAVMPAVDFAASVPVSVSGLGVRESLLIQWLPVSNIKALSLSLLGFSAIGIWGLFGGVWMLFSQRSATR